jgi:outer membrane protein TolC
MRRAFLGRQTVNRALVAVLVASQGGAALAQSPSPLRAMSLGEALQYARAHQPSLLAAQARLAAVRANAQVPRAQWTPRVAATAQAFVATENNSTASYVGSAGIDLVRIGGTKVLASPDWVPAASTLLAVGLRQEVFDFGRIAAQESAADALVDVEKHRADLDRLDLDLAVTNAFYSVTAARSILQSAEQAVTRAKVNRDTAQAGVTNGLRRPLDLTRAEADFARYDVGRIRAEAGLEGAQSLLAAAVGVSDLRLDASGNPPELAGLPPLDAVLSRGRQYDPGIESATAALAAQQATTRAILASLRPDLQLSASVSSRAGGASPSSGAPTFGLGLLPVVPNYDAGLVLSWPLYDGVIDRQRAASQQVEEVRKEELGIARLRLDVGVQQAWLQAHLADEAIPALQRSAEAARANQDQAQARFGAGLATTIELAEAEDLRVQAEIQLAVGRFEQARARAQLNRAIAEGL